MLAIKAMVVASHKVLLLQVLARRDLTTPHAGHGPSDQYLPFRMFVVWACETSNLRPISRCVSPLPFSARISRSEEHTSELQSLMRISYAVFCLKKKIQHNGHISHLLISIPPQQFS